MNTSHTLFRMLVLTAMLCALVLPSHAVQATVPEAAAPLLSTSCIVRVRADAPDGGDGLTWATAYNQLQAAMDAAPSGCEVWVAAGRYLPPANFPFKLKNGVKVYGGFVGTETNRYQRNWETNVTILSGDRNNDDAGGFNHMVDNTTRVVEAISLLDSTTLLDGFTISGGSSTGDAGCGGGIYILSSNVRFSNLLVTQNQASTGGGICVDTYSEPVFTNIRITNNHAGRGGGMRVGSLTNASLVNVYFYMNGAVDGFGLSRYVGGLEQVGGNLSLTNVWFQNNYAQYIGAMEVAGSTSYVNLMNVVIYNNHSEGYAGGLNLESGIGGAFLQNCTVYYNHAGLWGGGINNVGGANSYNVRNSIIWGNVAASQPATANLAGNLPTMSYSIVQGVANNETVRVYGDRDPKFVALASAADLHLQSDSPAINTGYNVFVPVDTEDLDHDGNTSESVPYDYDGKMRISNTTVDMGAFEYPVGSQLAAPVIDEGNQVAYRANLMLHAADQNLDTLTWDIPSDPMYGSASLTPAPDGSSVTVTYTTTPENNYPVAFPVRVSDGGLAGAGLTDMIIVNYTPEPPTISNISDKTTNRNIAISNIPFTIGDLITDPNDLELTTESSNTTLLPLDNIILGGTGSARTISLTPATGQHGTALVTVRVTAGTMSSSDTFLLTVTNHNTAPNASDDAVNLPKNTLSLPVMVMANDSDVNLDPLTITEVTQGQHGSVTLAPNRQSLTYTPSADYAGADAFSYTISDGFGGSDTAVVSVSTSPLIELSLKTSQTELQALGATTLPVQFTIQNAGPDSSPAAFQLELPNGVHLVEQGSSEGCTQVDQLITCTPRAVPPAGLTVSLNLAVGVLPEGTQLICHGRVTSEEMDRIPSNNQVDITLNVYWLHQYLPFTSTAP